MYNKTDTWDISFDKSHKQAAVRFSVSTDREEKEVTVEIQIIRADCTAKIVRTLIVPVDSLIGEMVYPTKSEDLWKESETEDGDGNSFYYIGPASGDS